jgi:predicted nucleic acid-binding protein
MCPPVAAEFGFSARSGEEHTRLMDLLAAFPDCELSPESRDVLDIQNRLWNGGLLRSAGANDTLIAAYASKNAATIVHYDQDFEHIASVAPDVETRWIVPKGSI